MAERAQVPCARPAPLSEHPPSGGVRVDVDLTLNRFVVRSVDGTGAQIEGNHVKRLILRVGVIGVGVIILSLAYFAEPVAAQTVNDLVGSWEFTIELPQRGGSGGSGGGGGGGGGGGRGGGRGGFGAPQTLMLALQDGVLQGTIGTEAASAELRDIMLEGNTVTFTATRQTRRGSFEATYTGEIGDDGDTITGTFGVGQGGGFTINWTATRTDDN